MSAKHTPGPWMCDSDPIKGDPLNRVRYRVVARGKTITQCYYSSSDEQAEHDARLIAAAPDLLEALVGMLSIINDSNGVSGYHLNGDIAVWGEFPEVDAASAAIAKATGQKGGA